MALDSISGRVFREAAIPGLTDQGGITPSPANPSGVKDFPKLTPAQSLANAAAAGAKTTGSASDPMTKAAGGSLDKNAFLKLLVQEMTNQDPLKPADNTQFIAQLAQFSTLEQMQNMNTGFQNLQSTFQASRASSLLGVEVTAVNSGTGAEVKGVVDQIVIATGGAVEVDISGTKVNLADIISIGKGAGTTTTTGSGTSGAPLPGTLVPPSAA